MFGATDSGGNGGADSETSGPRVVSVLPETGAQGVTENVVIKLTFSEPMDEAATEAAYDSSDAAIDPNQVEATWNSKSTVLTLTPKKLLPYPDVTLRDAPVDTLAFRVQRLAKSKAGIGLTKEFTSSFSTLKRVTQTLAPDLTNSAYTLFTRADVCVDYCDYQPLVEAARPECPLTYSSRPGRQDFAASTTGVPVAGLYSFALEELAGADLDRATLSVVAAQWGTHNVFDASTGLGIGLSVDQLPSAALTNAFIELGGSRLTHSGGVDEILAYGTYAFDVRTRTTQALADADSWIVFRSEFEDLATASGSNPLCSTMSLEVSYLTP